MPAICKPLCALLLAFALCDVAQAQAVGTLINTGSGRQDMVYDATRNIIYVVTPQAVLRYDVASSSLLSPIPIPVARALVGVDISANDKTLVIGDTSSTETEAWVWLVSLDTLEYRKSSYPKSSFEIGSYSVAFGADNSVYATSTSSTTSIGALRRLSPKGEWRQLTGLMAESMLSPSGDGLTIAFVQPGISDGRWGLVDVPTGQIVSREFGDAPGQFAWEVSSDRLGSQFIIPTYNWVYFYGDAYQLLEKRYVSNAGPPIGVRHHPVEQIAYIPFADTREVRVYDTATRAQIGSHDFGVNFTWPGNTTMWNGRVRLSRDGSLLMVSVNFGVRFLRLYAPLTLLPLSGQTTAGQVLNLPLGGSIGNGGALTYDVLVPPEHGSAKISAGKLVYTPEPGFIGRERFIYRVGYGTDFRHANVDIEVRAGGAMMANNDTAVVGTVPRLIPVLANDLDSDGNALQIVAATQPRKGGVAIQGDQILYTPPPTLRVGTDHFTYTISNGASALASAVVTLVVPMKPNRLVLPVPTPATKSLARKRSCLRCEKSAP